MSQETSDRAEAVETRSDLQRSLHQLELMESYLDMCDRLVDMSDISRFGDENPNSGPAAVGLPDAQLGMSRAYIYPSATSVAYINEVELRWIRARSRAFVQLNPYAAGAVRNRIAYTVGSGHIYKVSPRPNGDAVDATDLLADCRTILAEFIKKNRWTKRQKETIRRLDRDGERFLRFFPDRDEGCLYVRFIEPLEIQNPPGAAASDGWFFGVRFEKVGATFDMETAVEYAITEVNAQGSVVSLKERVPADDVQRLTGNVDLSSPRGLPTFFSFQTHLNNAVQTLKATGKIVEFRARIGMIRRHVNATKETVQRVADRLRQGDQTYDADGSPRVRTAAAYPYAAIIDTSDATDYQFPSAEAPVDKNVAAIQAELRAVAAALAMPEYMLSGDASNANYSSTMVAEGPAVKTFEELQADLIDADVEVMERALCVAAAAGRIRGASGLPDADDYILDLVRVDAEPPIIKSENRMQEVQADKILVDAGVMSLDTFAARHGLEYEGEKAKIAQQPSPVPGGDGDGGHKKASPQAVESEAQSEDDDGQADVRALVEGLRTIFVRGQPKNAGQFAKAAAVATRASTAAQRADVAEQPPPVRQQLHAAARDAHRVAAQVAEEKGQPQQASLHRDRAAQHAAQAQALSGANRGKASQRGASQRSASRRGKPIPTAAAPTATARLPQSTAKVAPSGKPAARVAKGAGGKAKKASGMKRAISLAKFRDYLDEVERIALNRPLLAEQKKLLKKYVGSHKLGYLGAEKSVVRRILFGRNKAKLIREWEQRTKQVWPQYRKSIRVDPKAKKPYRRSGRNYDAHEIIPNSYNGPLEWWNIHPAKSPKQHQSGIHGSGRLFHKLFPRAKR